MFLKKKQYVTYLGCLLVLSGCGGEFSYKRGAQVNELNMAKSDCSSQYESKSEIDNCLKNAGWITVDFNSANDSNEEFFLETLSTTHTNNENDPVVTAEKAKSQISEQQDKKTYKDPTERIKVNSWWKAGAGPDQLKADGKYCLETLGDEHYINSNMSEVSIGIAKCMQQNKWRLLL